MSEQQRPESFLGALFGFVALMLVVGLGVAIYGLRVQSADSRGLVVEILRDDVDLPYGFELVGGTAVAGKQRWIRFERVGLEQPDPALPEVVLFARFPGPVAVRRQFSTDDYPSGDALGEKLREWRENPDEQAFTGLVDAGVLEFGPFETDYIHLRDYLPSGEFYDLVRVDLSLPDAAQLLVAHWPVGSEQADVEQLRPVLGAVRLPDPSELERD